MAANFGETSTPQNKSIPPNLYPLRELIQYGVAPRNILGELPRGTLHTWSGDAIQQAMGEIAKEGSGWTMGSINGRPSRGNALAEKKFADAMAAASRRNPGVTPRLTKGPYDRIWGWSSASVIGRGGFAGYPIEGHGPTSTVFDTPGYVQGRWERPARAFGGGLGGTFSMATGM